MSYDGSSKAQQHGFQAHVGMLPRSRGAVTLRSSDPLQAPRIAFNYLSETEDWRVFREAIRATRRIFSQPALATVAGIELSPGAEAQSDAQLDEFIRNHAESAYHPCGTVRMGNDSDAVVDPLGRVMGVERLQSSTLRYFRILLTVIVPQPLCLRKSLRTRSRSARVRRDRII